ncbi:MAG: response regulator transcription factor [Firmicutes bacterium]|nr:response regulator transcription factor [Bacillota bacterium]
MTHILIIEDEPSLRELLVKNLTYEGYTVEATDDGIPGLAAHQACPADLIVLDLMLPRLDGFRVVQELRRVRDTVPIFMLTARGSEEDRVKGLSLGADDYLVKPFSLLEFMARIKAILRRVQPQELPSTLLSGPFRFDLASFQVYRHEQLVNCTPREFRLLEILITHPGRTHSRSELVEQAWADDAKPTLRTVDVHIANLRRKLDDGEDRACIATVGGEGYRWTLAVEKT